MRSCSINIYTRLEDKNMDESDVVLNSVLEELKNKKQITELEEDIISAIKVFLEQPIDRNNVKTKINEIDLKYNTYPDLVMVMPKDSLCSLDELNDVEMRNNLYLRINVLLGRKESLKQILII